MEGALSKTAALRMLAYAEVAALPRSRGAVRACRATLARTRDFLMHAEARDALIGASVTAGEFDALREPALVEMRARCRACGLCARLGLTPP
jgi:hypothetical protein